MWLWILLWLSLLPVFESFAMLGGAICCGPQCPQVGPCWAAVGDLCYDYFKLPEHPRGPNPSPDQLWDRMSGPRIDKRVTLPPASFWRRLVGRRLVGKNARKLPGSFPMTFYFEKAKGARSGLIERLSKELVTSWYVKRCHRCIAGIVKYILMHNHSIRYFPPFLSQCYSSTP